MEKEYQKAIHHISTLILNHQYNRALNILNYLIQQGITNTQVTVMQAYCTKMINGTCAGIKILQASKNQGPLINMALASMHQQLNENSKCLKILKKIQTSQQQKNTIISNFTNSLQISLQPNIKPPVYTTKQVGIDVEAINKINQIIQKYKTAQIQLQSVKQGLDSIIQGRKIQGKLKQYCVKIIKYIDQDKRHDIL